ncbi:MAG: hypothetical protein ACLGIZ_04130 [Acidimicrobiia bacterium]|jgi:hypothetical protein
MAKPQQPELRRSGFVPALDPDATESRLDAHERPGTSGPGGPVPEDQRPGHHPDHDQDKPDLDKFAARLGIVPDDETPPEAPHVEEDSTVTRLQPKAEPASDAASPQRAKAEPRQEQRTFSPIGLVLVGPLTGFLVAKRVLRQLKRLRG